MIFDEFARCAMVDEFLHFFTPFHLWKISDRTTSTMKPVKGWMQTSRIHSRDSGKPASMASGFLYKRGGNLEICEGTCLFFDSQKYIYVRFLQNPKT